jgi:hypothetical protein
MLITFFDILPQIFHIYDVVVRVPDYRSRVPEFVSRSLQILGLELGLLSIVRITEELIGKKLAAPIFEIEITVNRDPLLWPHNNLYPQ